MSHSYGYERNLVIYLENFIINDILIGAIVYFLYIQKQAEYLLHQRSIMYQELIQVNWVYEHEQVNELVQVNGVYEHEQVNILSSWNMKI